MTSDPQELGRVYELLATELIAVARRYTADDELAKDVVHSVFVEVIGIVDRFDPAKPVRPWLARIVEHRARDAWRARVRGATSSILADPRADDGPGPVDRLLADERKLLVDRAVANLPWRLMATLRLHYWSGWSARRIAAAWRVPVGTIKSRLRRAKQLVRAQLAVGRAESDARPGSGMSERRADREVMDVCARHISFARCELPPGSPSDCVCSPSDTAIECRICCASRS